MNKVFRIVWNRARHQYVVVSELVTGKNTKSKGGSTGCAKKVTALLSVLLLAGPFQMAGAEGPVTSSPNDGKLHFFSTNAQSADDRDMENGYGTEITTNYTNNGALGDNSMAVGNKVKVTGKNSFGIGMNTPGYPGRPTRTVVESNNAFAIGSSSVIGESYYSMAIGENSTVDNSGYSMAIGSYATVNGNGTGDNLAIGPSSQITSDNQKLLEAGFLASQAGHSMAIGTGAKANTMTSTAVGPLARAAGTYSSSFGLQGYSKGELSTALTAGAALGGKSLAAMGGTTAKDALGAVAIGGIPSRIPDNELGGLIGEETAQSYGKGSVSIGLSSKAMSENSLALTGGKAAGQNAVAIGGGTVGSVTVDTKYGDGIVRPLGYDNYIKFEEATLVKKADNAVAIGYESQAAADDAVAIGHSAKAQSENSLAFGDHAEAYLEGSVALGSNSRATVDKGIQGYNPLAIYGVEVPQEGVGTRAGQPFSGIINFAVQAPSSLPAAWTANRAAVSIGGRQLDGSFITRQITGLAAGTQDTDAVNVAQLKASQVRLEADDGITLTRTSTLENGTTYKIKLNLAGRDTDTVNMHVTPKPNTSGTTNPLTGNTVEVSANAATGGTGGSAAATKFAADEGTATAVNPGETLNINGDTNITTKSEDHKIRVTLNKDLKELHSVTTDTLNANKEVNVGGNTYISKSGLNSNGNKIVNVADGEISRTSTDAINGSQLYQVKQDVANVDNRVNQLSSRMNHVGAGAAALAALHPLDFDPDAKLDFAAGYGHYKGANAAAIGAYYRANEDTMFSVGGTVGGGENMINAGVVLKIGGGNHVSRTRVGMAKEIKELRATIEAQGAQIAQLVDLVHTLTGNGSIDVDRSTLFPDIPQNHWAYDYVRALAGNGILEGYPDGSFHGDRPMTRYEMAALIYRALQNGANKADERMKRAMQEFTPELERIRVDTITKHKDGTPAIQRVRLIPGRF